MQRIIALSCLVTLAIPPALAQPQRKPLPIAMPAAVWHAPLPVSRRVHGVSRKELNDLARSAYPRTHYQRGMYYRQNGDIDNALIEFLKATQEKPRLLKAFYEQALIFHEHHYLKLAESSLEQALAVDADYQQARVLLATIRLEQGNVGGAVAELTRSLGLPDNGQQQPKPEPVQESPAARPSHQSPAQLSPAQSPGLPPALLQVLHSLLPEPAPQTPDNSANGPEESTDGAARSRSSGEADTTQARIPSADSYYENATEPGSDHKQPGVDPLLRGIPGVDPNLPSVPPGQGAPASPAPEASSAGSPTHKASTEGQSSRLLTESVPASPKQHGMHLRIPNPFSIFKSHSPQQGMTVGQNKAGPGHRVASSVPRKVKAGPTMTTSGADRSTAVALAGPQRSKTRRSSHGWFSGLFTFFQREPPHPVPVAEQDISPACSKEAPAAARETRASESSSAAPDAESESMQMVIFQEPTPVTPLNLPAAVPRRPALSPASALAPPPMGPLAALCPAPLPPPTPKTIASPVPTPLPRPVARASTPARISAPPPVPPSRAGGIRYAPAPPRAPQAQQVALAIAPAMIPISLPRQAGSPGSPAPVHTANTYVAAPPPMPVSRSSSRAVQSLPIPLAQAPSAPSAVPAPARVRNRPPEPLAVRAVMAPAARPGSPPQKITRPFVAPSMPSSQMRWMSLAQKPRNPAPAAGGTQPASASHTTAARVPQAQQAAEDAWTKRLRYLAEHGTASLKAGEAFMFSEETGEAVLFPPRGEPIRRCIAPPRDPEEVALARRPDILVPQDLQYNLSLLGKLLPRQPGAPGKLAASQDPASNLNLNEIVSRSNNFWDWLKQTVKF